jgi:O-antigen/teichoic acid export membrane protein
VAGGLAWNVITQLVTQGSRVLVGIVLARLLTPHQFGLAGMAMVFTNFVVLFADLSLGAALVQRAKLTEADRSTIFWSILIVGVLCTLLGIGASGLVGDFYNQPEVGSLFAVLSLSFVLSALSATQSALAARELAYRRLQIREIASVMIGAAAGITAAVAGLGPWAIVGQTLAQAAAAAALIWGLSTWRPRLAFSRSSLHSLGGFGVKLFASRLLTYANLNADNLLVGRFLGSGALGIYSLAYNVGFNPMMRIALPFQAVVFPAYSRLQEDEDRLARAWLRSKELSAALLAPAFLAILVTAPDLVPVMFGPRWHGTVAVIQLLCVAGVAHSLVTLNWSVLQARGQATKLLWLNILTTAVTLAAFFVGLNWGVAGVAGCYAAARWILVLPDLWVTGRSVSVGPIAALRASGTAVPLATVAAAADYGLRALLVSAGTAPVLRLVVVLAVGGVLYAALLMSGAPGLMRELRGLRSLVAQNRARPAAENAG